MSSPDSVRPPAPPAPPARPPRRGRPAIAWIVIVLVALVTIVGNQLSSAADDASDRTLERMIVQIQAQVLVGMAEMLNPPNLLDQAKALDAGSVNRRQRYVALIAELDGASGAGRAVQTLDALIDTERAKGNEVLDENEARVQETLRAIFLDDQGEPVPDEGVAARIEHLDEEQRTLLRSDLGWFSGAILGKADIDVHEEFLAPAKRVAVVYLGLITLAVVAGLVGFALLVTAVVFLVRGKIRSGLTASTGHSGIYAETFAVWLILFVVLGIAGGLVSAALPGSGLVPTLIGFLLSLAALRWPVRRGIPWEVVQRDIGLAPGPRPWLETLTGMGGYLAALPLVAVGIVASLILLGLQGLLAPPPETFEPVAGPAHPIVLQLADSGLWLKLQVLLLASFAAPLVEETMFRGVLYRHLRDSSARLGLGWSILVSATLNAFVFAAIHPQGLVGIPPLMALAVSFCLLREWRGSLLPSMVLHGISNGVVMLGMLTVLGNA